MSRIEQLWEGWVTGVLTPEQVAEFQGRLADPDPETLAFLDDLLQSEAYQGLADARKEELLFQRIMQRNRQAPAKTPARIRFIFPRAAAAAILLLAAGLALFNWLGPRPTKTNSNTPTMADLAPGGNKAILTLANGQKINLDSATNGTLAEQGNTKISKLDNGKLSYNAVASRTGKIVYNTLTTPRGGQYQLILPDGTKVWLNAASSITYPTAFTGPERSVNITGEAYFEVIHKAKQPFRVHAADALIQDLGTHFNINAYSEEAVIQTTLLEGSISITDKNSSLILKPGQQATADAPGTIRLNANPDLDETMAWKNGLFQFNHADIETVMRQVSRWYDVDVIFEGPKPAGHFGGKISRNVNASQMLKVLATSGLHFRIEGRKLIITA